MRQRVARSRELVAAGYRPAVVARVMRISRQAIYRTPAKPPASVTRSRPPADEVEQAIVEVAEAHPTDGYRMVCAWVSRKLGRAINRKRVLGGDARAESFIQRRQTQAQAPSPRVLPGRAPRPAMAPGYDERLGRLCTAGAT